MDFFYIYAIFIWLYFSKYYIVNNYIEYREYIAYILWLSLLFKNNMFNLFTFLK